jgi:hypothetical protein
MGNFSSIKIGCVSNAVIIKRHLLHLICIHILPKKAIERIPENSASIIFKVPKRVKFIGRKSDINPNNAIRKCFLSQKAYSFSFSE